MRRVARPRKEKNPKTSVREDHPGRVQDGLVAGRPTEALDVLGGLLPDDVDDVVDRDHPQQAMAAVDHRDGHQVVLGDEPGDLLLVGFRGHAHRLLLAQEPDRSRRVGRDQPPPGQAAHQMVVVVDHVEDRGGLGHR
jgi:hypothetical protein